MTNSFTSGIDKRDTWVILVPCTVFAVVQAPMIGWLGALIRKSLGISRQIAVTFLSSSVLLLASGGPSGLVLMLTRSKVSPRLTTNGSFRWPTNIRPVSLVPGNAI